MKNRIFILILILCSLKIFGCSCIFENIAQDYLDADFVGIVTVKKTYDTQNIQFKNNFKRSTYKAELVFEKIYKGTEFNVLNIYGKANIENENDFFVGSCDLYIEKGEKYLVILNKNKNNEFWVSLCSRVIPLSSEENNTTDDLEKINSYSNLFSNIEKFKDSFSKLKFVNFSHKTLKSNDITNELETDFTKLNINKPNEKVGFYKIVLNNNLKISKIIPIKKIGVKDKEIENIIKKNLSLDKYSYPHYNSKEYLLLLSFEDL